MPVCACDLLDVVVFPVLAKKFGDRKAAGYRDVIDTVEEEREIKKIVDGKETSEKKKWKL